MPLLSKRIFSCAKSPTDVKPDESIYIIPHTKERFRSKDTFVKRLRLYRSRIWTCQSTGHVNLTHEEAWNSEKTVIKTLKAGFPPCYDKPVLEVVHHSTLPLETLVDQTWMLLQQVLSVGERVLLKVRAGGGKSMKAVVVKVDRAGVAGNPTSNCSNSPSSDKENTDRDEHASVMKKWVPPKLLPYKYSIRLEGEDSVIHSVPVSDLGRCDKPPSKELLRLFIRTYAVRAGQASNSPWIVDDVQVKKFDLPSKFASFLLSPVKWRQDEMAKKIEDENKSYKSPSKNSPRIKTKTDAKEMKRKKEVKKSIAKLKRKSPKKSPSHKTVVIVTDTDTSSDSEGDSSSDSDTPLSVIKIQLTPKKSVPSNPTTPKSAKSLTPKSKSNSLDLKKSPSLKKLDSKGKLVKKSRDKKEKEGKESTKKLKEQQDKADKKKKKYKEKKMGLKQLTLFEMSKSKGSKTPEKRMKSPKKAHTPSKERKSSETKKRLPSPMKTPAIVQKIQRALAKDNKKAANIYSRQAATLLNSQQRARLPPEVKDLVLKKFNKQEEQKKLSMMSESEKVAYISKRKEKTKKMIMEQRRKRNKVFEDTELSLTPLPAPKPVATPDNMPNETFGDVVMVTEFIACFSGLLMPEDEYPVYTDNLMKALSSGKDGFSYLSRVLTILLQTLLQDEIAEDYQELKVPLCDIPVNPCTTSELVRLCLRKQDIPDDRSDKSDESMSDEDDDEVPEELIQMLETQEFYQLEPEQKLRILKGLCLRIMGTYSVQDYMEEKQQESSKVWKEKQATMKADKKLQEKGKENEKTVTNKENPDKQLSGESKSPGLLLTHFYGNKGDDAAPSSGNNSETAADTDEPETDMASVVKRRRLTAAQAQQEKLKKEREDRERRQQEMEIYRKERERELFEKKFVEAIQLAKATLRQTTVGTDRNHSRYWLFSHTTPGLYLEKGWVTDDIEYSVQGSFKHAEDSSSSEDEEETDAANKKLGRPKKDRCMDTTYPHVSQNLWFTYDNMKDVDCLLKALHSQGARERVLLAELRKRYSEISSALAHVKKFNKEFKECDGDKEMIDSLKRDLLETELRLRNGGLGGVMDFQTWEARLETATELEPLANCILETQEHILEKFRDGIMAPKKRKNEVKEEIKEPQEKDDKDEEEVVLPGIANWREAVKTAPTLSRLHILLGILDSCVKWEKSAENAKCKICRKKGDEDRLLLCDDCNQAFHMYCLRPALTDIPRGDWHCPACAPQYRKRVRDVPGKYAQDNSRDASEDDEEEEEEAVKHEENCIECGGDENLIKCATCPSVYHLECHDPPLRHPPRGRWVCNDCKNGVKRTKRTANQRGARRNNRASAKRKRKDSTSEEEEDEEEDDSEEEDGESDGGLPAPKKAPRKSPTQRSVRQKKEKSKKKSSPVTPEVVYDNPPKTSRRAPSELSIAEDVINDMLQYKHAWPFVAAVNKKDVPDYYEIIKQPMDFQRIKDKLNCLVYGSPQEVVDDVALTFRNAAQYNEFGSDIFECMETSEKYFVDLLKKRLPFYVYNRDQKANGYGDHMYTQGGRKSRKSK